MAINKARLTELSAMTVEQKMTELAIAYHGARCKTPTPRNWGVFALAKRKAILDWATRSLTTFLTFDDLIRAANGYVPSLRADLDWRAIPLAAAYDERQGLRADPRKACLSV